MTEEKKDYIDITPRSAGGDGSVGKKNTVFQETERDQIENNLGLLTIEGVKEKIRNWENSGNQHVRLKYRRMLNICNCLMPSKQTTKGLIVLSYKPHRLENGKLIGVPGWTREPRAGNPDDEALVKNLKVVSKDDDKIAEEKRAKEKEAAEKRASIEKEKSDKKADKDKKDDK